MVTLTKYSGRTLTVSINGTPAGQMTQFGDFGSTRGLINASVYGETWTDFVTGLQDGDEVPAEFAFDPANAGQDVFRSAYKNASDTPIVITATHAAAGVVFTITCLITHLSYSAPLDGLFAVKATLKIVNPGVVTAS